MSEAKSDNRKENMFARLAAQQAKAESEAEAAPAPEVAPAPVAKPAPPPAPPVAAKSKAAAKRVPDTVGGKRNNPDYCQALAYLPKSLRKEVNRALLDEEDLDYSSLIEELLRKWLKSKGISA